MEWEPDWYEYDDDDGDDDRKSTDELGCRRRCSVVRGFSGPGTGYQVPGRAGTEWMLCVDICHEML